MHESILRAALDVFIESGVEGSSIERIARAAGVGKLTVYRRWDSKENLLADAIEAARGDVPEAADDSVPVAELLERALPEQAKLLTDERFQAMIGRILGSGISHPALLATYWEHYVLPRRRVTLALLQRAQKEGLLAFDADIDVLLDMMVGATMFRAVQPGTFDIDEATRYLRRLYRQTGLLPPG